jgi:hypothetical protein
LRAVSAAVAGGRVATNRAASNSDLMALGRAGAAGTSQLMNTKEVTMGLSARRDHLASTSGAAVPATSASKVRARAGAAAMMERAVGDEVVVERS